MTSPEPGGAGAPRGTDSRLTFRNRLDHWAARWGMRRMDHRVDPGLWRLGEPGPDAPVLVTANYTLSFDAVRSAMAGRNAWILVLDTKGINVWCAAGGKGFSTEELVRRIREVRLEEIVRHRRLVLPQLGAPGVSSRQARAETGFAVEFGPVRAADLPRYLDSGPTPEMRLATFPLGERIVLIPVELTQAFPWVIGGGALLWLAAGLPATLALLGAALAGLVLFPILLPFLPTRDFSTGGFLLGGLAATPWAILSALGGGPWWKAAGGAATALLALPPVTAFLALNFTGSTPFTSRTGVRREIVTYIPWIAGMFGLGLACGIIVLAFQLTEGP